MAVTIPRKFIAPNGTYAWEHDVIRRAQIWVEARSPHRVALVRCATRTTAYFFIEGKMKDCGVGWFQKHFKRCDDD